MGTFRYRRRTLVREVILILVAILWCVPFFFLVMTSLKPSSQMFSDPLSLPHHPTTANYSRAWNGAAGVTLGDALKSSLIITVGSVIALVLIGSVAAYAIARRPGRMGVALYLAFVIGIILPFQLGMVPAYAALRHLPGSP